MPHIRCSCQAADCQAQMWVEQNGSTLLLWVVDHEKAPHDLSFYLNPNAAVGLIRELQHAMRRLMAEQE